MREFYIAIALICILAQSTFCNQLSSQSTDQEPLYKELIVKKTINGRICDTCTVNFVHQNDAQTSYIITGVGHTPPRLTHLRDHVGKHYLDTEKASTQVHIISGADFGFSFLSNFLIKNGKRLQLYGKYLGADYKHLEFLTTQNGKPISQWRAITSLAEIKGFAVLGVTSGVDQASYLPYGQTFSAGSFHLAIKDTVVFTVRDILTKQIKQKIFIFRAEDKPTNFVYYQVPLTSSSFSHNIQNLLNISEVPLTVYRGDTLNVFEKDYASIGVMRFLGLDRNERLQYSLKKTPYVWQRLSSINSENGIFLILSNEMQAGRDQDIYLRFEKQPETIHKIKVKVKQKPFIVPWKTVAGISFALLATASVAFYLWHLLSKKKLVTLKQKNEDTETRLALLSGQLNPHFLFNTLNAIQGTINSGDSERVNRYVGNVAGFMRDVMDTGKKEFISLEEELKLESDYLVLESERKQFLYSINVSDDLESTLIDIPPLLLQPVLENSIRHAFGPDHADPRITIRISRAKNNLIISISDNGRIEWDTHGIHYGHGLSLTRKRIIVYNEKLAGMFVRMEINYLQGSGTTTIFTFEDWLS